LISASSAFGSAPWKFAQIVVTSSATSAYQTSLVCSGFRTRSTTKVQSSSTSVRVCGSVTASRPDTS
jgi:hypothetical protein